MSITREQIISLGFKPTKKKSPFLKKYDTLILNLDKGEYLYLGYSSILKAPDFKRIWKSFIDDKGVRTNYLVAHIGETSFSELKDYIDRHRSGEDN